MSKVRVLATTAVAAVTAVGVTPTMLAHAASASPARDDGQHSVKQFKVGNLAHPASASGSNQNVYISLQGSGLHVSRWYTSAWSPTGRCTRAEYWFAGVVRGVGHLVCNYPYDSAGLENGLTFKTSIQLCNTWTGVKGKPGEQVHK